MDNQKKQLGGNELAMAFGGDAGQRADTKGTKAKVNITKPKDPAKKKKVISPIIFVVGLITLICGVVFLVFNLTKGPTVQDGEYLVSAKEWSLEDGSNCADAAPETNCTSGAEVVWKFTEIGKGTLTTNNHVNDYDFIWALEDGKLLIETSWLYDLENSYTYELDRDNGQLILTDGDNHNYTFVGSFEKTE